MPNMYRNPLAVGFKAGGALPATHLSVTSGTPTAGVALDFTVTALDALEATATAYPGIVAITSSDGAAVLPANSTLTNGVGIFSVTLKTAGSKTVTGTDTVTASITGLATKTVAPAAIATLLTTAPATADYGVAITITVTAFDTYSNTATGYTGRVVFTSSDGSAVLPQALFSLSLDGANDHVVATNSTSVTSAQTSVSMWVRFSAITDSPRVVEVRDGTNGIQVLVDAGSGKWATKHSQFQSGTDATEWSTPSTGVWYHVAAVFDSVGNTTAFYLDGVAQTGGANSNVGNGNQANKTYIGCRGDLPSTTFFNGLIDDFRTYSRALTPTEITNLSAGTEAPTDYVARWKFTEGTGTSAADSSGNGNTGTLTNGPTWSTVVPAQINGFTLTAGTRTFSATLKTAGVQTITATDTTTPAITDATGNITVEATPLVTDTFTDTNGTEIQNHEPDYDLVSGGWINPGDWTIETNALVFGGLIPSAAIIETSQTNVQVEATISNGTNAGLVLRYDVAGNYWMAQSVAGVLTITEFASDVPTVRATQNYSDVQPHRLIFKVVGNIFTASVGVNSTTYTSSLYNTKTKHGVFNVGSNGATIDTFNAYIAT